MAISIASLAIFRAASWLAKPKAFLLISVIFCFEERILSTSAKKTAWLKLFSSITSQAPVRA